jgi:hypothetical protein
MMNFIKKGYVFCAILSAVAVTALLVCYFNLTIGGLPTKVTNLQREIELLKVKPDSAKTFLSDLQKLELKIEKTEHSIREDYDWLKKFGLPVSIIALVGLFYSIYKSALGFALENAKETVDRFYLPEEERFKRDKKLLVLTKKGEDAYFMHHLLKDTGFLYASTIRDNLESLDKGIFSKLIDGNKYDLILLNNGKAPFTNEEIQLCHDETPNYTMIFSFGNPAPAKNVEQNQKDSKPQEPEAKPEGLKGKKEEGQEQQGKLSLSLVNSPRVSSANFKSQVYSNLINALKYQQYLR